MPFGLLISFGCHAALLALAFLLMRAIPQLPLEDTPAISAEIITPSEFLRLKKGSEDAKVLESKAKEDPKPDDSKNDTKKPDNAPPPPPPPQEVAKLEPPPPPEPPKVEPPPPEPPKVEAPPPPPEPTPTPTPGPTPDEQKALEQKLEDQRKADEAKQKAEDEAKKKKLAEELKKKKLAEAKKKADEAKKKFDPNAIANLLEKSPDDAAKQKALIDKDPKIKGQQAAGTSQTATATGQEAGTATGTDTVLSAREQDLLKGMIKSQLTPCASMPGGGGGNDTPIVTVEWKMRPDGSLEGEPVVIGRENSPLFQIAAEASLRAVKNCAPFQLPPDKFDAWKSVTWQFDWPAILGLR